MSELWISKTILCMQDSKLKGNISRLNLVTHFLQIDQLVNSVLLPKSPNSTHIIASHTNCSMRHLNLIIKPTIKQMLSLINRPRP